MLQQMEYVDDYDQDDEPDWDEVDETRRTVYIEIRDASGESITDCLFEYPEDEVESLVKIYLGLEVCLRGNSEGIYPVIRRRSV
ncbi:MAG: hypothetical protein AAF802_18455 [Planctomycetota bacterium]